MATYHINIAEITQGIAEQVAKLQRALNAVELYEYVTDCIVGKYPNILEGELQNFRREVIKAINTYTYQESQWFDAHQRGKRDHWNKFDARQERWKQSYRSSASASEYAKQYQQMDSDFEKYKNDLHEWEEKRKTNYGTYVSIPGLTGWSAPAGYNVFCTSKDMKGSKIILKKANKNHNVQWLIPGLDGWTAPTGEAGSQIKTTVFEEIKFQFIPSALCL